MSKLTIKKDSKCLIESIAFPILFITVGIYLLTKNDYIFAILAFIGSIIMIIFDKDTIFSSSNRIIIDNSHLTINNAFNKKIIIKLNSIKNIEPKFKNDEITSLKISLVNNTYNIYNINCTKETFDKINDIIK